MATMVAALFDDFTHAQGAVDDLINSGFPRESIGIIAHEAAHDNAAYIDRRGDTVPDPDTKMAAGMGVGAVVGGAAGLVLSLGALVLPGIGPVVAAGTLYAVLSGALLGAATGGAVTALVEAGVPRSQAEYYAEGVRRGGTLVTVEASQDRKDAAEQILNRHGAVNVEERAAMWRSSGWSGYDVNAQPYTREQIARAREDQRKAA